MYEMTNCDLAFHKLNINSLVLCPFTRPEQPGAAGD